MKSFKFLVASFLTFFFLLNCDLEDLQKEEEESAEEASQSNPDYTPPTSTYNPTQAGTGQAVPLGERSQASVFISGHSLSAEPLGEWVGLIASSLGDQYAYNEQIVLGSPIRVRTRGLNPSGENDWRGYSLGQNKNGADMNVITELRSPQTIGDGGVYDTLVIGERHDLLGTIQWESTASLLRHFHDRLREGNSQGITYLNQMWLDIDKNDPSRFLRYERNVLHTWECIASKVNLTLAAEGSPQRVLTLPSGMALTNLVEAVLDDQIPQISGSVQQKLDLIFQDNVHLTDLGIYYMAAVTYSALFRKNPVGAATPQQGPSQPLAAQLQSMAWEFISGYYATENVGVHDMEECRLHVVEQVCDDFWANSNNSELAPGCRSHFADADADGNPFRWPDTQLKTWAAP